MKLVITRDLSKDDIEDYTYRYVARKLGGISSERLQPKTISDSHWKARRQLVRDWYGDTNISELSVHSAAHKDTRGMSEHLYALRGYGHHMCYRANSMYLCRSIDTVYLEELKDYCVALADPVVAKKLIADMQINFTPFNNPPKFYP